MRLQAKAEEVTARLDAELKAAELLKATAEANISALQKQVCGGCDGWYM
jgi:hypothetical protein